MVRDFSVWHLAKPWARWAAAGHVPLRFVVDGGGRRGSGNVTHAGDRKPRSLAGRSKLLSLRSGIQLPGGRQLTTGLRSEFWSTPVNRLVIIQV